MANFDIDGDLIRKLADLLRETGLNEIEFAEGDKSLRVSRGAPAASAHVVHAAVPAAVVAAAPAATPVKGAAHPGALTSPMVGTAYLAPEPGAGPFVKVGDTVKAGQTVLIIEAMKVMNPIKAPRGGTVTEVAITDGQPVEFGEVLLVIE
ncbi:acetyl-CoA carboxylase biotin carboxyl carrier protein [Azospirillum sp. TSO22-1]|uniref:acetyl-CoA carboxylase biotin carboxyl carrier protein n=1 Tax=Azospirillum sp. TSO22-1 TaxID=716789 RepID=UPI000D60D131|nr:acetyl-CoA carboxylase biotin carboxyl carrier protein [Azospirillum sp. TSO22-1]PWC40676.1 acetyl-CoA carboxylase [Azospirillum sp. TSO22-1]